MDKQSEKKFGLIITGAMFIVVALLLWLVTRPTPTKPQTPAANSSTSSRKYYYESHASFSSYNTRSSDSSAGSASLWSFSK